MPSPGAPASVPPPLPGPADAAPHAERNAVPSLPAHSGPIPLDHRRYLRVVRFLVGLFLHLLWWDVLRRRLGAGGGAARTADARWGGLARDFRDLALDQGGVLIKLGQFLSIRVDILPTAVTAELRDLQDAVPPERFEGLLAVIRTEFGRAPEAVFPGLDPAPLGSASLAQVHRAHLEDGRPVVVKVQRPRIEVLVETDLAALRFGVRLLKLFGPVRRRVDLDALFAEFARVTRGELDFAREGRSIERFGACFAGEPGVRVPRVHWSATRRRVLAMEDVTGIKVNDHRALAAAGIRGAEVATLLARVSMTQVFTHNFVHADPHPGNIFVHPLPPRRRARPGDPRPFRLAYVDFGMMAEVPESLRAQLREYLLGFAARDAARVVRAYQAAGVILPGTDLKRLEQAQRALFDRFWGVRLGQMQQVAQREARQLLDAYSDLFRAMPFQLPVELLFVGRAIGMVVGLATSLDPDFDGWAAVEPFAKGIAADEAGPAWRAAIDEAGRWAMPLLALPARLDRTLDDLNLGELRIQAGLAPDARRAVQDLDRGIRILRQTLILALVFLGATVLRIADGPSWLTTLLLAAAGGGLLVNLFRR